jgi:hypothetical protein
MEVITQLLEEHGQWGSGVPGVGHEEGSYDNAFLITDAEEAWILETAGRHWVADRITHGVQSISNQPTIQTSWTEASGGLVEHARRRHWWESRQDHFNFALAYGDHEHYSRQVSHIRRMRSLELLERTVKALDCRAMMDILRDHYEGSFLKGPQFHAFLPDFHTLCMHDSLGLHVGQYGDLSRCRDRPQDAEIASDLGVLLTAVLQRVLHVWCRRTFARFADHDRNCWIRSQSGPQRSQGRVPGELLVVALPPPGRSGSDGPDEPVEAGPGRVRLSRGALLRAGCRDSAGT